MNAGTNPEATLVQRTMLHLTEQERVVIETALARGFTHRDIADLLGLPDQVVKEQMRAALAGLAAELGLTAA